MTGYGRTLQTPTAGVPIAALFNLDRVQWKPGGATIDWDTVAAVSGSTTLLDNTVVTDGNKYLRYGQVMSQISATGYYGPYDSDATDGRQRIDSEHSYILNETLVKDGFGGFTTYNNLNVGLFNAGTVWRKRILYSSGAHSLASGPTLAEFKAAFPLIRFADTNL